MRLYLDEDLSPRVVALLRARGLDSVGAHEAGQAGRSDLEQLRYATLESRCLVTRNVADYLALVPELVNRQESHAGILLVPASFRGDEFAALAEAIARCMAAHPQGLADQVVFLRRGSGSTPATPPALGSARQGTAPVSPRSGGAFTPARSCRTGGSTRRAGR